MNSVPNHLSCQPAVSSVARPGRILAIMAAVCLVAGCSQPPVPGPRDTGNMAYPPALPQGNVGSTPVAGRAPTDTGNMAYPRNLPQGNVGTTATTARPPEGGSMAYPDPAATGTVGTTRVR